MNTHSHKFKLRLGLFVAGGLALFVIAVFIIGKQKNLFNPVIGLTTNFRNVSGLQVGNNIRFSGINIGTVNNITIINDTTVSVDMVIRKEVGQFIKSNCIVSIGSEGLIGDRLLVISQVAEDYPLAKEGQVLASLEPIETDAIVANLQGTSKQLEEIVLKLNTGGGTLGRLINDTLIAENLNETILNIKRSTQGLDETMASTRDNVSAIMGSLQIIAGNTEDFTQQLGETMTQINSGHGTLGRLIQDTVIAENLTQTIMNLKASSSGLGKTLEASQSNISAIMESLEVIASNTENFSQQLEETMVQINSGNGTVGRLVQDTTIADNLNQTLINLKNSSEGLDENMEALKHNFLFKGYFKKLARKEKQMENDSIRKLKNKRQNQN
jgi:phospholipid/cholesterol/gamma-HCH transport system substrate-binding protein